jgi:hypothetical protein
MSVTPPIGGPSFTRGSLDQRGTFEVFTTRTMASPAAKMRRVSVSESLSWMVPSAAC